MKMTPIEAIKKTKEKVTYNNLKDNGEIKKPKTKLGQLVRNADIKRVFGKGDSANWSYTLHEITEVIYDTIASYRTYCLLERYFQNLLLPTNLTLEEKNQVKKVLNLNKKNSDNK